MAYKASHIESKCACLWTSCCSAHGLGRSTIDIDKEESDCLSNATYISGISTTSYDKSQIGECEDAKCAYSHRRVVLRSIQILYEKRV